MHRDTYIDRSCRSKKAYTSEAGAKIALQGLIRTGKIRIGEMEIYPCRYCKHFHVGHAVARWKREAS